MPRRSGDTQIQSGIVAPLRHGEQPFGIGVKDKLRRQGRRAVHGASIAPGGSADKVECRFGHLLSDPDRGDVGPVVGERHRRADEVCAEVGACQ